MGTDYRDDLSAAHARIAELEDKIAALEAPVSAPRSPDGRFPELEEAVRARQRAADPKRSERTRMIITWVSILFPLSGAYLSMTHRPLQATFCSVVYIALVAAMFIVKARLKPAKRALEDAEQRLADARKLREYETQLAAVTTKLRVETSNAEARGEPRDAIEEPEEAVPSVARRS